MDRQIVRGMVEDYWRARFSAAQSGNVALAEEISVRFEQRVQQTAALLPVIEAAAFHQAIEAEREKILTDYENDPAALKKRLGVSLGIDAPLKGHRTGRQGLGELAVRTAVRATVWETIWSLFRR
jgi:hypothetical protein